MSISCSKAPRPPSLTSTMGLSLCHIVQYEHERPVRGAGIAPSHVTHVLGSPKSMRPALVWDLSPPNCTTTPGMQERGQEFGATTGRVRRCGWFDAVSASLWHSGVTSLALTKLDVLAPCRTSLCVRGIAIRGYFT